MFKLCARVAISIDIAREQKNEVNLGDRSVRWLAKIAKIHTHTHTHVCGKCTVISQWAYTLQRSVASNWNQGNMLIALRSRRLFCLLKSMAYGESVNISYTQTQQKRTNNLDNLINRSYAFRDPFGSIDALMHWCERSTLSQYEPAFVWIEPWPTHKMRATGWKGKRESKREKERNNSNVARRKYSNFTQLFPCLSRFRQSNFPICLNWKQVPRTNEENENMNANTRDKKKEDEEEEEVKKKTQYENGEVSLTWV